MVFIYKAVVIAKLTYTTSVWCGYASSADRQRIKTFVRRGVRCGFRQNDLPTIEQLVEDLDQTLFKRVLCNKRHVLHCLLPDERPDLPYHSHLSDCNFISRFIFTDIY